MINLISEIGSNHNGSLKRITGLLQQSKACGFNAVKFQLFKAELLTKNIDKQKQYKQNELDPNFIPKISEQCKQLNLKFGITPFYLNAIDQTVDYVDFYKISSFDIDRTDLISRCIATRKDVFISLGLATIEDIQRILELIKDTGFPGQKYHLLHCVSKYPTDYKDFAPKRMSEIFIEIMKSRMNNIFLGYSDHTRDIDVLCEAIKLFATTLELHFDLDDLKGSESANGHCWCPKTINKFYDRMTKLNDINTGKFILTTDDLKQKADKITGYRS